jgi:D-tyrosyl-tRNA(Tyr) deacylase
MRALIQRVSEASVSVENNVIGKIQTGILAFIGIEKTDTTKNADHILEKILNYRIFNDAEGRLNLSLRDIQGGLLLVSQFTLVADTGSGTRPGFSKGMPPAESAELFQYLNQTATTKHPIVASGQFGANMKISLCNEGPITFLLQN